MQLFKMIWPVSWVTGFWMGFWAPLKSLSLLFRSPKILVLVVIPLLINIALYIAFFSWGHTFLDQKIQTLLTSISTSGLPTWLYWIMTHGLKIIAWLLLGAVAALSFTIVSSLICSPFNDALSRATRKSREKQLGRTLSENALATSLSTTLSLEAKRMSVLLVGSIIAVIIGIIPLLQIPALIIGALLISFEYFGYPISQERHDLKSVWKFTLGHPMVSVGFGSFLLLAMILPFTSIFYIPLAVMGGTLLHVDLNQDIRRR